MKKDSWNNIVDTNKFRVLEKKIIFIGFNKTATSSFHMLLLKNGLRSIHSKGADKFCRKPFEHASERILSNIMEGRNPLEQFEGYSGFKDLTFEDIDLCRYFREIYLSNPDYLYVLNTRPMDEWITSRKKHNVQKTGRGEPAPRIKMTALKKGLKKWQVIKLWRDEYVAHHAEVRSFFQGDRKKQFLKFNIHEDIGVFQKFISGHGIQMNMKHWGVYRKTGQPFHPQKRSLVA